MGGEAGPLEQQGRFESLELFNGTATTGTASTGSVVDVSKAGCHTIFIDCTGATSGTGTLTVRLYGRLLNCPWMTLHTLTSADPTTSIAFVLNTTGITTGATAGMTGINRWDNMRAEVEVPAMTNAAHTVKIRNMTTPELFHNGGV